ncbi:piRNA biogenesis protein EXD1 [Nephila pilipes]|uniref:PiRNA biogenesis protein EXD1 n=1 Tax=Nephila pilipes TaxID=299642 RepID=A0A8X6PLC2_NEPPI|nr:piRNA biogenesis protein EXD1 [Nephila pilipes]
MCDLHGDYGIKNENSSHETCEQEYIVKLPHHLHKCLPTDWNIIDSYNDDFDLSVKHMNRQDSIGISLEGPEISRSGILTWLCVSTSSCTFLFDILTLGKEAFRRGLKSILENSRIQKIFHDCRLVSDCLYHQYEVRLNNVFDTQAADSLVMMQQNKDSKFIKKVNSLNECLNYYLEITDNYLCRSLLFDVDEQSIHYHGRRPLHHEFQESMIRNVIYLRLLKREVECALLTPLRRVTDQYLNCVLSASDQELVLCPSILEELPQEVLIDGIEVVNYVEPEVSLFGSWDS